MVIMKKTIYYDMDGVLANFDKECHRLSHLDERPWLSIPGFFRGLEPIGNPNETIKLLQEMGYKVYILTKVEMRDRTDRANDKIDWVMEHLPSLSVANLIIVPGHESKLDYIKTPIAESVLVDDYKGNLMEWHKAGGIAVKFGNKWKQERKYYQICCDIFNIIPLVESLK
jgi:5'(3')-deoxyribonucleotidase